MSNVNHRIVLMTLHQIFRCWTVYNKSWRVAILPFLLLLYNISSIIIMTSWNTVLILTGSEPSLDSQREYNGILGSYFAATIIINI